VRIANDLGSEVMGRSIEECSVRVFAIFAAMNLLVAFPGKAWPAEPFPGIDPSWVLLHEPAVLEELKLSASQRQAFGKLIDDLDLRVFPLRNKPR